MSNVDFMSSKNTLYFAYGSNLDFEDWTKWCDERNITFDIWTEKHLRQKG